MQKAFLTPALLASTLFLRPAMNCAEDVVAIPQRDSLPGMVLPQPPADGLPLAQIFETGIADRSVYTKNTNKVYFVWGARTPEQPAGVIASRYFPSFRNPDKELTIDWYRQHHPDWIIYKEDRVTPAYGFIYSYGGLTPLDISNPEVREYYFTTFMLPAVQKGYRMVAMDNVDLGNGPKGVGHFAAGQWQPLYTGKKNDSAYQKNVIDWLLYLRDRLHPLGVTVAANITFTSAPPEIIRKAVDAVDIWLDETGFAHRGQNIPEAAWRKKFDFLKEVLPSKPYITINQLKGSPETATNAQVEWVMANFLLCRSRQSLLAMAAYDTASSYKGFYYRPDMDIDIGAPVAPPEMLSGGVWMRRYQQGIVFVNPSATQQIVTALPPGDWQRPGTGRIKNEVLLPPSSGLVLSKKR